jgi:hypothetical protein
MMKMKSAKMLPKISHEINNGGIYLQRIRCGKQNCKCARDELHISYYFFTRRNGRLTKTYIRKSELEAFRKIVEQSTAERQQNRRSLRSDRELIKAMNNTNRETAILINQLKRRIKL